MLSTLRKERHMVAGSKTTEDWVHSLNIYVCWSVMDFFSSKNLLQKHQAYVSLLKIIKILSFMSFKDSFWATVDFPESQSLLTFPSDCWLTNSFLVVQVGITEELLVRAVYGGRCIAVLWDGCIYQPEGRNCTILFSQSWGIVALLCVVLDGFTLLFSW